jgi:hypothetical protein
VLALAAIGLAGATVRTAEARREGYRQTFSQALHLKSVTAIEAYCQQ